MDYKVNIHLSLNKKAALSGDFNEEIAHGIIQEMILEEFEGYEIEDIQIELKENKEHE